MDDVSFIKFQNKNNWGGQSTPEETIKYQKAWAQFSRSKHNFMLGQACMLAK